jgi:hypothetical protein
MIYRKYMESDTSQQTLWTFSFQKIVYQVIGFKIHHISWKKQFLVFRNSLMKLIPKSFFILTFLPLPIDTQHTEPWQKLDRSTKSKTSCHCSTTKQCNIPTFSSSRSYFFFHIDTHHTQPWLQSDRWWRSTTSCHWSTTKQCSIHTLSSNLSFFLFHIDAHHTKPWVQSNRWWRSTTSCQCSTTKQCNISIFSSNLSFFLFHIDTHHT